MEIELWPLDRPKPYSRNPRKNKRAIEKAAASIREFGFRQPIVVDGDGVIVVGHTRLEAAKQLSLEVVPVHQVSDLSEEQVRAYRIADNKTGEYAGWDPELLGEELRALKASDYDLMQTGFQLASSVSTPTPLRRRRQAEKRNHRSVQRSVMSGFSVSIDWRSATAPTSTSAGLHGASCVPAS